MLFFVDDVFMQRQKVINRLRTDVEKHRKSDILWKVYKTCDLPISIHDMIRIFFARLFLQVTESTDQVI